MIRLCTDVMPRYTDCGKCAEAITLNGGLYIPNDLVYVKHIVFVVDNVDFTEDTPDGKRTLRAITMAIYQRVEYFDNVVQVEFTDFSHARAIKGVSQGITEVMSCSKPTILPACPLYRSFFQPSRVSKSFASQSF